ncbi:MAG: hypothetical protein AAGD25_24610 [Cyanobacteria bacterium P01_F01_bin.150]
MRLFLQILLVTGFAIGLSSCSIISGLLPGGNSDDASLTENESVALDPNPVESDPADGTPAEPEVTPDGTVPEGSTPDEVIDGSVSEEEFGNPVVVEGTPVGNVPLDLITSTDPEERIRSVQRDRPDPFDILQTSPSVEVPDEVLNPPPDVSNPPQGDNGPGADSELAPIPELVPAISPPPPQPETARAVTVTGVVQIGSVPYAIVDAPNEPHGRYVRSGQFLSNGQVLVKQINMSSGIVDPVVILEEFGIEVARQVGDPGIRPEAEGTEAPAPGDVVYGESDTLIGVVAEAS